MENTNNKKLYIFYAVIGFLIFFTFEYGLFMLFLLLLRRWYFSLPVTIIITILFLRVNFLFWIYEWQFPHQKLSIYLEASRLAKALKLNFVKMKCSVLTLLDENALVLRTDISSIKQGIFQISLQMNVYEEMQKEYNSLSKKQYEYYLALLRLNEEIEKSGFKKYFEDLNFSRNAQSKPTCHWKMSKFNYHDQVKRLQLQKISLGISVVIQKIGDYLCEDKNCLKKTCSLMFNDSLSSPEKLHIEFKKNFSRFSMEEFNIKSGSSSNDLNFIILHSRRVLEGGEGEENLNTTLIDNKKKLLIVCGPNGGPYELSSMSKLSIFLENGIDLLLWNYRGFGLSTGKSTFNRCKSDIEKIYDHIAAKNLYCSYGVMGYSIGGVAACHLAKNRRVEVLISDRNFSSIGDCAYSFPCGIFLSCLYKVFLIFSSKTIDNFLNSDCYKIILCSPTDSLIYNYSSIKTNVSRFIMNRFVRIGSKDINKIEIKNESFLDFFLTSKEKEKFIECIKSIVSYYYKKKNEEQNFSLEKNSSEMDYSKVNDSLINFNISIFVNLFSNVTTENIDLFHIRKYSNRRTKIFLNDFFTNFFVYGTKKPSFLQNTSSSFSEEEFFDPIYVRPIIAKAFDIFSEVKESVKETNNPIIISINQIFPLLNKILEGIDNLVVRETKLQNTTLKTISVKDSSFLSTPGQEYLITEPQSVFGHYENYSKELLGIVKIYGNLIRLNCGHNGLFSYDETQALKFFLREKGFMKQSESELL